MSKEKKKINKNDELLKRYYTNQLGLLVQSILVLFVIVFGVATIFEGTFGVIFQFVIGLTLLVMVYNNHKMYKRAMFTIPYAIGALIAFMAAVQGLLG